MWIIARYLPVSPFSLKMASATASGGKTLLVPTPYALKMALLDVAIRTRGLGEGERLFPFIRDLGIALAIPEDLVVIKGFGKIRRLLKDRSDKEKAEAAHEKKNWPLQSTIAYREYVYYREPLQIGLEVPEHSEVQEILVQLCCSINYLGKRGGFVQILEMPGIVEKLPEASFFSLTEEHTEAYSLDGTLQMLDDCGKALTFQQANIYTADRITMGKDRVIRHIVLPYRLHRSSHSYSWYRAIQEGTPA